MGERKFIEDGIRQRCRVDGRGLLMSRGLTVAMNTNALANGSSSVCLDLRTPHVLCSVKADVVTPTSAGMGEVVLAVRITEARTAQLKRLERDVTEALERLVLAYLDRSQLLILAKERCWQLGIDVTVLDSEAGNLVEHTAIGVHAALQDTKIPKVRGFYNATIEEVSLEIEDGYWSLSLPELPLVFTAWKIAGELVADVTGKEQQRAQGCLHIAVSPSGQLCGVLKDSKRYTEAGSFALAEIALATDVAMRSVSLILASLHTGKVRYRIGQT